MIDQREMLQEVSRLFTTFRAGLSIGDRAALIEEYTGALQRRASLASNADIRAAVEHLIDTSKHRPSPQELVDATISARSARMHSSGTVALRPNEIPEGCSCKCGARARVAVLERRKPDGTLEEYHRIIDPCRKEFHLERGEGYVPYPPNFLRYEMPEETAQGRRHAILFGQRDAEELEVANAR